MPELERLRSSNPLNEEATHRINRWAARDERYMDDRSPVVRTFILTSCRGVKAGTS